MNSQVSIVVPVSGGKDSQACLKMAVNQYGAQRVRGVFCDTSWEHPLTYQHIKNMEELYGVEIEHISAGSVEDQVIKRGNFPDALARFCTSALKIAPSIKYYKSLLEHHEDGFVVWYGMRTEESHKRKKRYQKVESFEQYPPHEINHSYPKYLFDRGCTFQLPIIDWAEGEVFDFLEGEENPLYSKGFNRVGCFPCLASGKQSIRNAFHFDSFGHNQKLKVQKLEECIGQKHIASNTEQLCMFCQV